MRVSSIFKVKELHSIHSNLMVRLEEPIVSSPIGDGTAMPTSVFALRLPLIIWSSCREWITIVMAYQYWGCMGVAFLVGTHMVLSTKFGGMILINRLGRPPSQGGVMKSL